MTKKTLLLIEDDVPLAQLTVSYLQRQGYQLCHATTVAQAVQLPKSFRPSLIICDVMLPDQSGFAASGLLVSRFQCPLLFLTALDSTDDQITGLTLGACDYIVKPVQPALLLAKIEANLRKTSVPPVLQLKIGSLLLDKALQQLTIAGEQISLTTMEFALLWIFAQQPAQVLSREYLFEQIVGRPYDGMDRAIDAKVSRLRKRLQELAIPGLELVTVHGRGYQMCFPPLDSL